MRGLLVTIHRWAGLFIAAFLFVAGLTGSVISWDHEIDEWLNPDLFESKQTGSPLPPLELVSRFEATDRRVRVTSLPLSYERGKTAELFVEPRIDPSTGKPYIVDYNQVYVEPATGQIAGKRFWGKISLDRRDLLPFLYKLHYSMHVPDFFNSDQWGIWLMGLVGLVWTFDCFVGLWLTFPTFARTTAPNKSWLQRWMPAWRMKPNASFYRLNFDLHRATGLWMWLFLLILAFTSISMNLGTEIVRPMLSKISTLTPEVWDVRSPAPLDQPIAPGLSFKTVIDRASKEARRRSWKEPPGSASYSREYGVYSVSFFEPGAEHGESGMGTKTLYFDGKTGVDLGESVPWTGSAADIFMQLQFPLHSGRIAGLPGRILLSVMGLVVAILSLTGIVIWFKKRLARMKAPARVMSTPRGRVSERANGLGFIIQTSARYWDRLTDEGHLRSRFQSISRNLPASDTNARVSLSGMALFSIRSAALIVFIALVGAGRFIKAVQILVFAVWRQFRFLIGVVLDPNFWKAGKADVSGYAWRLAAFVKRFFMIPVFHQVSASDVSAGRKNTLEHHSDSNECK
ncbi:PepSY-associated TM helix domain-containing protein [Hyphomicrobium sp.]|uniref:PepSY-associated TM helix domain-containing protein n=1 Tax=Hyphomicrobium sp. TaxID=82 RepID=UPI002CCAA965|nr:PepSY-associated TM helix domain-containing protein [Hyphomicrobium sp.]HVZ03903.1 PepSY-associated TM helix domain-containing protein [Hyphomicrobium sp.]